MGRVLKKFIPTRLRRLIGCVLLRIGIIKKGLSAPELQTQIISAVELCTRGDPSAGEALLQRVLNRDLTAHRGLPREYIREFLKAAEQRHALRAPDKGDTDTLLQQTRDLDVSCLPCTRWIVLQSACICNGLFKVGGAVRDKAIEAAYEEASDAGASVGCLVQAFKAAIDQSDFETARGMLHRLRSVRGGSAVISDVEMYYYLNIGDTSRLGTLTQDDLTKQDAAFAEYVNGKSIAVVGPAPSGEAVGADIDSFDVVVRFTYRGREFLGQGREFGTRTDVSFVAGGSGIAFGQLVDRAFFDDLRFVVFKGVVQGYQKRELRSRRGRVLKRNRFLFAGTAMIAQNALFDLFRFRPGRVKLFHINFFLARDYYHAGYAIRSRGDTPEEIVRGIFARWRSFATHGIINQLNFTRNLWKAGLLEADGCGEAVLRLTTAEYLSAMEEVWVVNPIKEYLRHVSEDSGTRPARGVSTVP